jgi:flagellar basal body rod protein FlgF
MTRLEKLAAQVARAQEAFYAAQAKLQAMEKDYEKLCKETEEQVEQSGKGFSRTLYYQGKSVKVAKQTHSWVIVRKDKSREHYNSLRQIRLGIVDGTISI